MSMAIAPFAVRADPIRIVSLGRITIAGAMISGVAFDEDAQRDMPQVGAFARVTSGADSAAGTSSLIAGVSPQIGEFFGLGSAGTRSETAGQPADGHASSRISTTFETSTALSYDFVAAFGSSGQQTSGTGPYHFGNWTAVLRPTRLGRDSALFSFDAYDDRFVRERGVIPPGRYDFQIGAQAVGNSTGGLAVGFSEFNFSLNLTTFDVAATPEPNSQVLVGTGMISLFGLWRRSAHRRVQRPSAPRNLAPGKKPLRFGSLPDPATR
jgi:hypothetical protein